MVATGTANKTEQECLNDIVHAHHLQDLPPTLICYIRWPHPTVPTMYSSEYQQNLKHTSILRVICCAAMLCPKLWLQLKSHYRWRVCSGKHLQSTSTLLMTSMIQNFLYLLLWHWNCHLGIIAQATAKVIAQVTAISVQIIIQVISLALFFSVTALTFASMSSPMQAWQQLSVRGVMKNWLLFGAHAKSARPRKLLMCVLFLFQGLWTN